MIYEKTIDKILERENKSLQTTIQLMQLTNDYVHSTVSVCQQAQNGYTCAQEAQNIYSKSKKRVNTLNMQ